MNNLLRTLTQTNITGELRLLLTNVKDGRSGDKGESFYDALDGVLNELRTVTVDNHDAEAFLKPVTRSEVPDYLTVIAHPMDLGTMQKRVKNKHYRNKAEFNADLETIWNNCYTYNAVEGHPLRKCVDRLRIKAHRLLANITDRKERIEPPIPIPKQQPTKIKIQVSQTKTGPKTFEDMPALVRTPEGMAKFAKLQSGVATEEGDAERPRKRAKLDPEQQTLDPWWSAICEPEALANALPPSPSSQRSRRRKCKPPHASTSGDTGLLKLMNNNIRTIKRVRRTHTRFTALNDEAGDEEEPMDVDEAEDPGWSCEGEVGQESADQCLNWMGRKVLEHTGFQGTSRATLGVLAGVTSEYFQNVGRTIRFLSDKFGSTMSAEEIILHTLFESGITRIQDLERYVKDDVERYGSRLGDLEKKLVGAYREATSGGPDLEDEGLFEEDDEDEAGVLALGDFADTLGMDYLGLRELGIAEELGITNLTIPKKLLRGKRRANVANAPARPTSPPPPYPPPPPFVPITASRVEDQIGLLRERYRRKVPPPHPVMLDASGVPIVPMQNEPSKDEEIPDDAPSALQARMGPLGQIAGSQRGGGVAKKSNGEKKKGPGTGKKKKTAEIPAAPPGVIVAKG